LWKSLKNGGRIEAILSVFLKDREHMFHTTYQREKLGEPNPEPSMQARCREEPSGIPEKERNQVSI
jgi:hypothetical protein